MIEVTIDYTFILVVKIREELIPRPIARVIGVGVRVELVLFERLEDKEWNFSFPTALEVGLVARIILHRQLPIAIPFIGVCGPGGVFLNHTILM